ncbi:Protein saf4 [Cytospora paraplurivora]|uniref:Protein saf4 n=1 Tax=Cytospora paraplurivora TaxID=2898453 RepID=A0AAN9TZE9_9PEZI
MQGFNMGRYVPPDQEGLSTGNQLARKHPLGARASRLKTEGILTVRFEMPFAVWCDNCRPQPGIIGQGVRFNAEKKKVGNYYSSPVYSFRMRHVACGGWIEVRTDPKNTAYVVVAGGRKRDTGEERVGAGEGDSLVGSGLAGPARPIRTLQEQAEERESAFANLEKTIEDRAAFEAAKHRIGEIHETNEKQWDDPYSRNQLLRKQFRVGRKQREKDAHVTEGLKDRMSLGIELLPESEEDARWARLVDFGSKPEEMPGQEVKVLAKPLFGDDKSGTKSAVEGSSKAQGTVGKTSRRKLKSEIASSKMRESLVSEIVGNTRLASDPFLEPRTRDLARGSPSLPGLKRKRKSEGDSPKTPNERPPEKVTAVSSALVDYDSD